MVFLNKALPGLVPYSLSSSRLGVLAGIMLSAYLLGDTMKRPESYQSARESKGLRISGGEVDVVKAVSAMEP